jgi:hypothetical protein
MIKNRLKTIIIGGFIVGTSLMADYTYNANSLLGFEGGYTYATADTTGSNYYKDGDSNLANLGIKIGAETDNFRVFFGGRYYYDIDENFDYLTTYGIDIQYKFNFSRVANFYLGLGGGVANAKITSDTENFDRTISDGYYNVDGGFNFHMGDGADFEIGGRYLEIDAHNIKNNVDFHLNGLLSAYASLIFRWKMD